MRKWLLGLTALLVGGLLGCGEAPQSNQPPPPPVKTEVIKHRDGSTEIRSTIEEPKN